MSAKKTLKKYIEWVLLPATLVIALLVRFSTISGFKIYKDSFKMLFIAKATENLSFVSNYYPHYADFAKFTFLTPYKWLFGYLIGIMVKGLTVFGFRADNSTFESTAHSLVILSSVLTVFLIYKLLLHMTKDPISSIVGSTLFAFSGVQSIWNAFIITDTFAAFLLVLFIYIRFKIKNPVLSIIFYFLLYLTRPEYLAIPFIVEILNLLIKIAQKRKQEDLLLRLSTILLGIVFVFTCVQSSLISRNITADPALWLLLAISISLFLFTPKNKLELSKDEYWLTIIIMNIASALMVIYYLFNPGISRYISDLVPLFAIIIGIAFVRLLRFAGNRILRISILVLLAISLSFNIVYILQFIKPENPEYNTEVAAKVLEFAKTHNYKTLYVGQEESYMWEDQSNDFTIIPIDKVKPTAIPAGSLFINDPSVVIENPLFNFDSTVKKGFRELLAFTPKAPFRINESSENGWVEVWVKE